LPSMPLLKDISLRYITFFMAAHTAPKLGESRLVPITLVALK